MSEQQPVVRVWTGAVRTQDREEYVDYVERTGMEAYRSTPGNLDAWILTRDLGDGHTDITTVSRWEPMAAVIAFAGDDPERAVTTRRTTATWSSATTACGTTCSAPDAAPSTAPQRTPHAYVCCCSFKYMSVSVSRTPSICRMRLETRSSKWASLSHTTSASTS